MEASRSVSQLRVVLYARVSTLDKGQDVNLQLNELREYSQRRGWEIADEYVDNGVSGAKESRPELNRLMADAKKRNRWVALTTDGRSNKQPCWVVVAAARGSKEGRRE